MALVDSIILGGILGLAFYLAHYILFAGRNESNMARPGFPVMLIECLITGILGAVVGAIIGILF